MMYRLGGCAFVQPVDIAHSLAQPCRCFWLLSSLVDSHVAVGVVESWKGLGDLCHSVSGCAAV